VQDPAFALVEPHQVPLCPTFQPVQVTLNGSTAFWCICHFYQFGVISKLAEGVIDIQPTEDSIPNTSEQL